MEDRNGRARSALESMKRRQLEARRLSDSSPIAGLGTYQVMRPARGRELAGPQAPRPRPPRMPRGSDSFGVLPPAATQPGRPAPIVPRDEDRTMLVAPRLYRAEIDPPVDREAGRNRWLLPIGLACAVSTALILLAVLLR